jgi:hypothetical protein
MNHVFQIAPKRRINKYENSHLDKSTVSAAISTDLLSSMTKEYILSIYLSIYLSII